MLGLPCLVSMNVLPPVPGHSGSAPSTRGVLREHPSATARGLCVGPDPACAGVLGAVFGTRPPLLPGPVLARMACPDPLLDEAGRGGGLMSRLATSISGPCTCAAAGGTWGSHIRIKSGGKGPVARRTPTSRLTIGSRPRKTSSTSCGPGRLLAVQRPPRSGQPQSRRKGATRRMSALPSKLRPTTSYSRRPDSPSWPQYAATPAARARS